MRKLSVINKNLVGFPQRGLPPICYRTGAGVASKLRPPRSFFLTSLSN